MAGGNAGHVYYGSPIEPLTLRARQACSRACTSHLTARKPGISWYA